MVKKRFPVFASISFLLACTAPVAWGQALADPYNQLVATSSDYVAFNMKESSGTGTGVPAAYLGIVKTIQTKIPYEDWTTKALVTFTLTAPAAGGGWELEFTHGTPTSWRFGKAKGDFVDGQITYEVDPQKKKRPKTITLRISGIRFTCPLPEAMEARQRYGVFKLDSHNFEGCVSELPPMVLAQVRQAEGSAP